MTCFKFVKVGGVIRLISFQLTEVTPPHPPSSRVSHRAWVNPERSRVERNQHGALQGGRAFTSA
jgi:hypothetical protein